MCIIITIAANTDSYLIILLQIKSQASTFRGHLRDKLTSEVVHTFEIQTNTADNAAVNHNMARIRSLFVGSPPRFCYRVRAMCVHDVSKTLLITVCRTGKTMVPQATANMRCSRQPFVDISCGATTTLVPYIRTSSIHYLCRLWPFSLQL